MSTDFKPSRIATLPAGEPWSIAGVRAIRSGSAMSYKLSRTVLSSEAPGGEAVFAVPETLTAYEVRKVYVDDVLKETPGDYTIGDGDPDAAGSIVFGAAPAEGAVVKVDFETANAAAVIAGDSTFFDTHRINAPAWDSLIPTGETVCEVM